MNLERVLKQSISLHWLRPDNALWVYGYAYTFGDLVKGVMKENGVTLDLGCGDGTTSFVMLEGETSSKFDVFQSVQASEKNLESDAVRTVTGSLSDENGDFYNYHCGEWDKMFAESLVSPPKYKFTVGSDWKDSLVKKASGIQVYGSTIVCDSNIVPWPWDDESFDLVFTTILYWLKDPVMALDQISRVLKADGILCFSAPKPSIMDHTLKNMMNEFNYPEIGRLDRGRHENWKRHSRDFSQWKKIIDDAGFVIEEYKEFHPSLQIMFGETIMRTYLPAYKVLMDGLSGVNKDLLYDFKDAWQSETFKLLSPVLDRSYFDGLDKDYHAFVVRKRQDG